MPTNQVRLSYLVMSERYRIVRVMVSEDRWATLCVIGWIATAFLWPKTWPMLCQVTVF